MKRKASHTGFVLGLIFIGVAQHALALPSKTCSANEQFLPPLPDWVLRGKNIQPFSLFKPSPEKGRTYMTEIGGATLLIDVRQQGKIVNINRHYLSGNGQSTTEHYQHACESGGHFYADQFTGIYLDNGLLFLEQESSVQGIPENMWVYYDRVE